MQIWNYNPVTGELIGPGAADPNPMEVGEWLVPAYATPINPGEPQPGRAYRFTGSTWESLPDHRGETWWKADAEFNTEPVVIGGIGDPIEHGLTNVEPPAPPEPAPPPLVVSARQIRMALTRIELRAAVEAYVASADQDTKDWWAFATEFQHGNAMIAAAAEALGKSPADVDALFDLAKTL